MKRLHKKIIIYSLLGLGSLGLLGCQPSSEKESEEPQKKLQEYGNFYFEDFGIIAKFFDRHSGYDLKMELGDIDGDGDLDIVLANKADGFLIIYENRVPQKSKTSQEKPGVYQ